MIMIKGPQLINISLNMILSRSLCGLRPPDRELEENPRSGHWGRQLALWQSAQGDNQSARLYNLGRDIQCLLWFCVLLILFVQEEWYRFEGEAGTQLADERSRPGWEVTVMVMVMMSPLVTDAFLSLLDFDVSVVRHFLWQLVRFVFSGVWHK